MKKRLIGTSVTAIIINMKITYRDQLNLQQFQKRAS